MARLPDTTAMIMYEALDYFSNHPQNWIRGTLAKNKNDRPVNVKSKGATHFCLLGIIGRKYNPYIMDAVGVDFTKATKLEIGILNDGSRNVKQMISKFRRILLKHT